MKQLIVVGVTLIVLGLAGFIVPRVGFTTEETVVDVGPIEIQADRTRTLTVPSVAAGAAVVAGTVLVIVGAARRP